MFHREFGGLHKAALILAVSSVVSALFGILRDRLLAGTFGAGQSLDIYYAAFKIPDFIYIISLSLVSVNALIPFFLEKESSSKEEAKKFLDGMMSFYLAVIVFLSLGAFFAIPYLSDLVAPGFSPELKSKLVLLSRLLLLSPFFLGLSNLVSTVVQSHNKFFVYALSPIFYNFGIIAGIVFFLPAWGLAGVVFGVILGALAHFAIQLPAILKLGFFPLPSPKMDRKEVLKVAKLSLPRTLGLGLNQIILIFITAFASLAGAGSIAVFNLSFNLQSVPLAVIGMSYSVAAFPTLAKLFVNDKRKEFLEQAVIAVRQIIFWSAPAAVLIIVLRAQIVRAIFGSGYFTWQNTRLTAAAMAIFAVSITAQSMIVLFVRAFYASGKTWKPIVANVLSACFIIGIVPVFLKLFEWSHPLSSFFETVLRVKGVAGTKMLAFPTAFSLGMIFNCAILFCLFQKEFGGVWSGVKKVFAEVLTASVLMGVVSYFLLGALDNIFDINTFVGILMQGIISAVFGGAVWYGALRAAGSLELKEITGALKQRFWKTPVIASEPENLDR